MVKKIDEDFVFSLGGCLPSELKNHFNIVDAVNYCYMRHIGQPKKLLCIDFGVGCDGKSQSHVYLHKDSSRFYVDPYIVYWRAKKIANETGYQVSEWGHIYK